MTLSCISILLIICLFSINIIIGLFFFNFSFTKKDALSRSFDVNHLLFRFYQISAVAIDSFIQNLEEKMTFNLYFHTVFSLILTIDYYNRLPYYNRNVSQYYCIGISSYFWINFVLLVSFLMQSRLILENVLYLIVIGLVFFLYIVKTYREYFYREMILQRICEVRNDIQLDVRFRYLVSLANNMKNNQMDELLTNSLIKVHREECVDWSCICKNRALAFDPKKQSYSDVSLPYFKDPVFVKNYLLMMIEKSVMRFMKSPLLNLDLFLYLYEEMENFGMVNKYISIYEKKFAGSIPITLEYSIFRIKISLFYHIKKLNKKTSISRLHFENIRKYDETLTKLKDKIFVISDEFSRMWDILNHPSPDLSDLDSTCRKLIHRKKDAKGLYEEVLTMTNKSSEFLALMNFYAKFIIFDSDFELELKKKITPEIVSKLGSSVKFKEKKINYIYNNFHEQCASIYISFNHDTIGTIVYASRNCERVFKYDPAYLASSNINILQPQMISIRHDALLRDRLESCKRSIMWEHVRLWAVDKDRTLFSFLVGIKPFICSEGLTIASIFKRANDQDYMLLNERGEINGMGERVKLLFEFSNEMLSKPFPHMYSALLLCPGLIPFFLPALYNQPQFDFTNLPINKILKNFNGFYFFKTYNHKERILRLSENLRSVESV